VQGCITINYYFYMLSITYSPLVIALLYLTFLGDPTVCATQGCITIRMKMGVYTDYLKPAGAGTDAQTLCTLLSSAGTWFWHSTLGENGPFQARVGRLLRTQVFVSCRFFLLFANAHTSLTILCFVFDPTHIFCMTLHRDRQPQRAAWRLALRFAGRGTARRGRRSYMGVSEK
jgi:hypothetical protein